MLARFRMVRGRRPEDDPLPEGIRQDTRKHTRHCLRPTPELVRMYLEDTGDDSWKRFEREYVALIERRFAESPEPFDELAELSRRHDVYLGCNCPTRRNPDVNRCHTILALQFMQRRYRDLEIVPGNPRTGP